MTLIHDLDLDIVKMYLHTKTEVSRSRLLKVRAEQDRQTDTHTDTRTDATDCITMLQSQQVIKC